MVRAELFVGRGAQLSTLRAWADEVVETRVGRFALVRGEAGFGKTRLCAELARRLASGPVPVAWSRCWADGGGPPLWPWPDLVADLGNQLGRPPEFVPEPAVSGRFGLFSTLVEQLRAMCSARPAVALIDDLHAANDDVLLVTRFVARSLHQFPLLLVATWRVEQPASGAAAERLGLVAREASVLELPPFTSEEVVAYLRAIGRRFTEGEIDRLVDCTGGNPMYLAELLRHPRTDADLEGGLALMLALRVADFDPALRRIVGAVSLLGPGTTVAEAAGVAGCGSDEVLTAVQRSHGAVAVVGGELRFSHELVRAAFEAALPIIDRQQLHSLARDAIGGPGVDQIARRAHHAVEAAPLSPQDTTEAVRACIEAATARLSGLAFEQAAEWGARATALARASGEPVVEATALLTHADAILACGRLATANELYARAVGPAEAAGDPRLLARAALGLGGVWVEEQRDELSRRRMLNLCRKALEGLPSGEELLAARLSVRLAAERSYDGVDVDVADEVDRVRRLGDPPSAAEALSLYHHTLLFPERAEERLRVADELIDVATRAEATIYSLFGLCWRTVDLYLLGDGRADLRTRQPSNRLHRRRTGGHADLPSRRPGPGRSHGWRGLDPGNRGGRRRRPRLLRGPHPGDPVGSGQAWRDARDDHRGDRFFDTTTTRLDLSGVACLCQRSPR
jgi:AAA ATPase domain